jgi:hypothetical protein
MDAREAWMATLKRWWREERARSNAYSTARRDEKLGRPVKDRIIRENA